MNEQKKTIVARSQQGNFVAGVMAELRRVTWPTRDEWVSATVLTIGLVVGIGLFTFALDRLFGYIFSVIHPSSF